MDQLLKEGYSYIVDADLKSYFDTIPHDRLMTLVGQKVSDGRVLSLIGTFLKQGILDGLREWTPEEGSPQGAVISPLLSNIYLNPLDHLMAQRGFEMVRYADDFVIMCRSPEDAARALALVQQWTVEAGLKLHPDKTKIVNATTMPLNSSAIGLAGQTLPATQEHAEDQGHDPSKDEAELRGKLAEDHQRPQAEAAGLV